MPVAARPVTSRPCHGHDTPGSYTRGWARRSACRTREPSKLDSMPSSIASAQPRAPLYILDGACGWLPGEQRAIFMPAVSQHTAPSRELIRRRDPKCSAHDEMRSGQQPRGVGGRDGMLSSSTANTAAKIRMYLLQPNGINVHHLELSCCGPSSSTFAAAAAPHLYHSED
ncbi:hypothetical protein CKAH01_03271 [Colletotrichum kahawae]|uniref:Uncharacterized protein n=1 Tax=Colletotrichum kahawae TaxID=34407 RepID=A0AAD9YVJ3_COLKA|nr:hypothetical protein CKAH01_03271 [Colletotrichum kahawae]